MYKHILIPTDGSPLSQEAAKVGLHLAKSLSAVVLAINITKPYTPFTLGGVDVLPPPEGYEEWCKTNATAILDAVKKEAVALGIPCATSHIVHEQIWQAIIEAAASEKCDLIHMGSHGRGGVASLILGSETHKVLTHSKIPVLVHR